MKVLKKSLKGFIDLAIIPVEIVKDIVALAGDRTDENGFSHTGNRLRKACDNFVAAYESLDEE